MQGELIPVTSDNIVGEAAKIKIEGYKFITISCIEIDVLNLELLYHFDKNLTLRTFKLNVPKDSHIQSISPVYFAAFLVENEIQDLFGLKFKGLPIDYDGTFYLASEVRTTPFCRYMIDESKKSVEST
ncbi:MAG: NADH-quinone oxidoreductase subunit C [Desulfobacterales bacterium]|nr:NADH-quinone oxidoreductase subunit C [Desulfobacterales bacterium]MBF0395392.1 NADH-quinone oxidoreductase subunit C [Desulfobacterales bacterium]